MRTLRELGARFYRLDPADHRVCHQVETLAEAQAVQFLCPKCFEANGGPVGTHRVKCWFRGRGVPDDLDPKPGRWTPAGTGLDDLTFVPGDPPIAHSVQLRGGCNWHGFIENGRARTG